MGAGNVAPAPLIWTACEARQAPAPTSAARTRVRLSARVLTVLIVVLSLVPADSRRQNPINP
jgi:hypothetical protein